MILTQIHHGTDEVLRCDDIGGDHRLDDPLDLAVGEFTRIGHAMHATVLGGDLIRHVWGGGNQIEIEFAAQPFGHDLHVEQAEEAAPEAEAQGHGSLRLVDEGRVVEFELVERLT